MYPTTLFDPPNSAQIDGAATRGLAVRLVTDDRLIAEGRSPGLL